MKDRTNLDFSISSDVFNPFWTQLYRNMGYSKHYQRFVIVEPLGFLLKEEQVVRCVPVEPIVYPQVAAIGEHIASYIDREWGDDLEQVLVFSKKFKTILLTDEESIFQKQRLPELLVYLKDQSITERVLGLVHYHIDEPELSCADVEAINHFTKEIKTIGGSNQVGIVISDSNPQDTLDAYKTGQEKLERLLSLKIKERKINFVGNLFAGDQTKHIPLKIKLEF